MATRLLLVRHGESEWNALGRWQGQADPPLSDLGRRQARFASRGLGAVDAIVASPLQRAAESAAIIAEELGVGPVTIVDNLKERDAGEWSGLTRVEIDERFPGWLDPPPKNEHVFAPASGRGLRRRPPGWEHDDVLLERALLALDEVEAVVPDGDILVVTHGGVVYAIEHHLGAQFRRLANLEGRWLVGRGAARRLGDRVRLVDPDEVAVTVPDQL